MMISCCVSMSDITHLNTCLFPAPDSRPLPVIQDKWMEGQEWGKLKKKKKETFPQMEVSKANVKLLKKEDFPACDSLCGGWTGTWPVSCQLIGSCDSGHSLLPVCSCSFLLLGHSEVAGRWCCADKEWPLVSGSSVTSLQHLCLPSLKCS